MEPNESISGLYTQFTNIVNNLKNLDKSYTDFELCKKVLRSLPHSWEAKVTTIQEAKDLNILSLEELLRSLMTYELNMKQHQEEDVKKKRTITLKSTAQLDKKSDDTKNEE